MEKPEELQQRIEQLRKEAEAITKDNAYNIASPVRIGHKQLEISAIASQLAEISSRRLENQTNKLIFLTWALVFLTLGLLIFTIIQLILVLH